MFAGKDRTGLVAMLFQFALFGDSNSTEAYIVKEYAISESLLGGEVSSRGSITKGTTEVQESDLLKRAAKKEGEDGVVRMDRIGSLRGSPPAAMEATIERIRVQWGSVDGYLDRIGFDARYRRRLRKAVRAMERYGA